MKTHKDLDIWNESIDLVVEIYNLTRNLPESEKYALSNQIQKAAISIPSNIAEGAARQFTKEFIQFLYIALGSLSELETQLIIAFKLNYISNKSTFNEISAKIEILRKKLLNFIKYKKERLKNEQQR